MSKTLIGRVTSDKADKTIVVTVVVSKTHPLYRKKYQISRKFMAHDEKNEATTGDKVSIVETRPLSARKRYKLLKIIERPVLRDGIAGDVELPAKEKQPVDKRSARSTKKAATSAKHDEDKKSADSGEAE